jgi:hypothetical protein
VLLWADAPLVSLNDYWFAHHAGRWAVANANLGLEFEALADGLPYTLGDVVPPGIVSFTVTLTDTAGLLSWVALRDDTGIERARTSSPTATGWMQLLWAHDLPAGRWLRVEAGRVDGRGLISAPVYVR